MKFGSLFAGIGGFDLGLERAGMTCSWQVEIDDYANKVLEKHWPKVKRYRGIREVGKHNLESVDLICGGFPCQPFSVAGKQKGKEDDRHLWPEMFRVIQELKPTWVIGENVTGIVKLALDQVLSDLESKGYTCQTFIIPAAGVDAPHRRDRVWILANVKSQQSNRKRQGRLQPVTSQCSEVLENAEFNRLEKPWNGRLSEKSSNSTTDSSWWKPEPAVGRVANGVPNRVDRLKCLGNAVVPQIVEILGRAILNAN